MFYRRFIMTFLLSSVNAWTDPYVAMASEKITSHTSKAQPGEEGCLEDETVPKGPEEFNLADALRSGPLKISPSPQFVHNWVAFPKFSGRSILDGEMITIGPKDGKGALVLSFLASWCLPCQKIIPHVQKLEQKHKDKYTDFYYILGHDTPEDAKAFVKEYKLGSNALMGTAATLEAFHQPELPTLYIRDRYRWLVKRYRRPCLKHLDELDSFLDMHTAF